MEDTCVPATAGCVAVNFNEPGFRYRASCTRPDCKFWHERHELKEPALDVADQLAKIHQSWVPFEVTLHLAEDGTVHTAPEVEGKVVKESRTYHLYAACSNVVDPTTPEASSLVSCVKVVPTRSMNSIN
jgi:hypothetical protein